MGCINNILSCKLAIRRNRTLGMLNAFSEHCFINCVCLLL